MAEWLKAHAWKACIRETVSWVRIPLPPPETLGREEATTNLAREKAAQARKLVRAGIDPIEHRKAERAKAALEAARSITFDQAVERYLAVHRDGWKNERHKAQWKATLGIYASPILGKLSAQAIDTGLVLRVLEPIWKSKSETASRLRGRIESVLSMGIAKARIRRAGKAISTSCCPRNPKCTKSSTIARCLIGSCPGSCRN